MNGRAGPHSAKTPGWGRYPSRAGDKRFCCPALPLLPRDAHLREGNQIYGGIFHFLKTLGIDFQIKIQKRLPQRLQLIGIFSSEQIAWTRDMGGNLRLRIHLAAAMESRCYCDGEGRTKETRNV